MRIILFILWITLPFHVFSSDVKDTLLIGYTGAAPFIIEGEELNNGISFWLWETCAKELQIDFQYVPMKFRDMLDSLESGGIDLSINPLTITSQRMQKMDFTLPFYAAQSVVVKGELTTFERFINFVVSFFSLSFLSGFLVLMILVAFFGLLIWYFEKSENEQHFRKGWRGLWDGLWWSVVTMTTVGYGDKTPKSRGGKVVALLWMFSGLLFISGLTASVASSLTVNQLNWNTSETSDFKDRPVGTINHSSSQTYLKDNFFRNIKTYPNVPAGLDALLSKKIEAFIYDEPILQYQLLNNPRYAKLSLLPHKFKTEFYAFGIPKKNTQLKGKISQKILEVIERRGWKEVLAEFGCIDE